MELFQRKKNKNKQKQKENLYLNTYFSERRIRKLNIKAKIDIESFKKTGEMETNLKQELKRELFLLRPLPPHVSAKPGHGHGHGHGCC